ncbi:MAG: glycosyltransferase, partial [Dysgonamonadaceae bacterium]|nr:glycosyltransferase [Dysgonamonadaceae bacterium]
MKFLFVVQGEGRGHLTQAITLRNMLTKNGHEVVSVLVGKSDRRELPAFFFDNIRTPVERFDSPNFLPAAKNKKVNIWMSFLYNLPKFPRYFRSIRFIHNRIQQSGADVAVNFYEIMMGVTYAVYPPRAPYISVAHQYLFLHPEYRFPPDESRLELFLLKLFTRITTLRATRIFALSIEKRESVPGKRLAIVPPLLRNEVLQYPPEKGDYLHGYLLNATYAEDIIAYQQAHPEVKMHFFWDKKNVPAETVVNDRLSFHTLNDRLFIRYMAGCRGYATTAGFESVCEALYFGKPVLMVPTHIEQSCNAYEAAAAGAGIASDTFDLDALLESIPRYRGNLTFRLWVLQAEGIWMRE